MKLKLSLKNSAKAALLFSIFSITLVGCYESFEPTYKEQDIPDIVKKICKEEYNLDVTTKKSKTTLWIYAPAQRILHKEFDESKGKIFDEEWSEKLRNILTTIGRVLINSDNPPEFYALTASDINLGLDYTIIGNVLDIKKSFSGAIPWTEAYKRYATQITIAPEAIGDETGIHIKAIDINLHDFLATQIAQRIGAYFQEESLKNYFKIKGAEGKFNNDTFVFEYLIENVAEPRKEIDVKKEILKIISYCLQTYEFKDFSNVEINDLLWQEKIVLNKVAILGMPID